MKNWIISLFVIFITGTANGQTFPEGLPYQAQVFSSSGTMLASSTIGVRFNIRSGSLTGPIEWQEDHVVSTNEVGHFEVIIGEGTSTGSGSVAAFNLILWGEANYFLEMLVDETNTGSFISTMTQQLYAVPFAFHSKTTSQKFKLSELLDVDTSGIEVGDILEWNGTKWVPSTDDFTSSGDTAQYAYYADTAAYADTAYYAENCLMVDFVDTAYLASYADSATYAMNGMSATYADSATYTDSAGVALYAINNWGIDGNDNTTGATNFLGTTSAEDLVIKTNNLERMRIKSNGRMGVGTATPLADFHIDNSNGVLFSGAFGTGSIPVEGTGTRFMWYPAKAAFRSGYVASTNWNDVNIGEYSFSVGYNNKASGNYSAAFGNSTEASGEGSFAAGNASLATGLYAIAMGHNPQATGDYGIALGRGALANAEGGIAIGYHPEVYANYGLGMGNYVKVYGVNGVAIGYKAQCDHDGTFVYSDQSAPLTYTNSTAANQFMVKASGGTIFYTSSDLSTGVELAPGGGAWLTLSDRNKKENLVLLDPMDYLEKLSDIEVYQWNYIAQDSSIRHIGPMAQDFYSVFGIGVDSTRISTVDFDGINMLLIKALYLKSTELEQQHQLLRDLQREVDKLRKERETITYMLLDLEDKVEAQEGVNAGTSKESAR